MTVLLSEAEVRQVLSVDSAISACEEAYRLYGQERNVTSNPSTAFMVTGKDAPAAFWLKGACLPSKGIAGVFFGANFGNFYFCVMDSRTGRLKGIVETAWITKRRTGATAAVATKWLAREEGRIAALIGAGRIGEEVVRALSRVRRFDEFRVSSRTLDGAAAFVDRLKPETGAPLIAVRNAEEAVRGADVVVTMTVAREPFFRGGWLKPGALVLSMGGMPELDFAVAAEVDRIFVDDFGYAALRGDFAAWIDGGHISASDLEARLDGDIGEVVSGSRAGRQGDDQRILAVIQGMAVCDLVAADRAIDEAVRSGLGSMWTTGEQQERPVARQAALVEDAGLLASRLGARRTKPAART